MNTKRYAWGALALPFVLLGCNVGMAPHGDDNAAGEALKKMNLQQKIDWINRSPVPPAEKQKEIDEAKRAAGQPTAPGSARGFGGPPTN